MPPSNPSINNKDRRRTMKTKTIFNLLAFAMLTAAMVLTTACSGSDDLADNKPETTEPTEPVAKKGYALPVTVSATRQGDDATRASYTGNKLEFSDGDKLFVYGKYATGSKSFAGALDYVSEGTFSGTIYAQDNTYSTYDALFTAASAEENLTATLLPNGYESTGFLSIDNKNTDIAYDDRLTVSGSYAFVASETAKATGVEQLSWEQAINNYSSGFALSPGNAILNFTITGLEAGAKEVSLQIHHGFDFTVTGSVTPNASGVATFAIGVPVGANIKDMSNNLTVGSSNFTLPSSTTFAAGKIYNINRAAMPAGNVVDLSNLSGDYLAQNGDVLTGTLAGNYSIDIANDATVTLYYANINGSGTLSGNYPGIDCLGNATIILKGTNVVKGLGADYPGIFNGNATTTLTIQGDGSLTATGHGEGAGIGGSKVADCGYIVINSGTITANGGPSGGAGIGAGTWASCKDITINGGTITATGGPGAAGIGSAISNNSDLTPSACGAITIANTVTKVTATKGTDAPCSIGKGADDTERHSTCGTVTIGGTEYWKNDDYVGTGSTYLTQSPLVYQP